MPFKPNNLTLLQNQIKLYNGLQSSMNKCENLNSRNQYHNQASKTLMPEVLLQELLKQNMN